MKPSKADVDEDKTNIDQVPLETTNLPTEEVTTSKNIDKALSLDKKEEEANLEEKKQVNPSLLFYLLFKCSKKQLIISLSINKKYKISKLEILKI